MQTVAVIPARGGSKRIPRKNIRILDGRPMIAHTIQAALESSVFDRVIVSTDSTEIADISRTFGAEVPFLRDKSLADDISPVSDVVIDAVKQIGLGEISVVAQLMPNCPLRNASDIRESLAQFTEGGANTQISVTAYGWLYPWWAHQKTDNNSLKPVFPDALKKRSQDLEQLFCPTGAVWWARPQALLDHGTFYAPGYSGYELPWDRALDIDDEDDWRMVLAVIASQRMDAMGRAA